MTRSYLEARPLPDLPTDSQIGALGLIGGERDAGVRALKAVVANIDASGELKQVSFGTPVFNDLDGYRKVPLTSMPYGQAMAILALGEFKRAFI
jgi:rhamnogalacturonyl hydrolase YesR